MENTTSLQLKNITKLYSNLAVLKNINVNVKNGEVVSLIGPSGCGKTTLLNIIAGVEKESSGTVLINNKNTTNRRGLFGYMPQEPSLLPWRTIEENLILGLDVLPVSKAQSLKKAQSLLKQFGLEKFATYYPSKLSGGMQQRVALLRTFLFNSSFLLLDEPFGSLDALTRQAMQLWLLDVWKKFDSTVLLVTHDIREAILLSDQVYILSSRPGRVVKELNIDLPRPRLPKHLLTTKARNYENKLLKCLL